GQALDTEGRTADETRELFTHWARHASLGVPAPSDPSAAKFVPVQSRHWRGLVNAFGDHRRDEVRYAAQSLGDLRQTVWSFVGAMHETMREERAAEQVATEQFERVRAAVEGGSVERLKREALAMLDLAQELTRQR